MVAQAGARERYGEIADTTTATLNASRWKPLNAMRAMLR
jgi:hypothetical protein